MRIVIFLAQGYGMFNRENHFNGSQRKLTYFNDSENSSIFNIIQGQDIIYN